MGKRSINKGKQGEREFAKLCRKYGYSNARRGQQYSGIGGADVVGIPGVHIEVKRTERLNLYDAMAQAKSDAKDKKPIVAHRRNNHNWIIAMEADDWFEMMSEWIAMQNDGR